MSLTDQITLSPTGATKPQRLLVVSEHEGVHQAVAASAPPDELIVEHAYSRKEGLAHFLSYRDSIVVIDADLLPRHPARLLELFKYVHKYTAIVIASLPGKLGGAVEYLRKGGCYEAVEIQGPSEQLTRTIRRAYDHLGFVAQNLFARYLMYVVGLSLPLWLIGVYGALCLLRLNTEAAIRLVLAHLCGDLVTYSPMVSRAKRSRNPAFKILATALHAAVHGALAWVWLWGMNATLRTVLPLGIAFAHFSIDFTRILIENALMGRERPYVLKRKDVIKWLTGRASFEVDSYMRQYYVRWFLLNIGDQVAHLLSIIGLIAVTTAPTSLIAW
ncbi:MAG: DUF3307 domain-containing protein [Chitinivibrionales bacterium]|nr:DUF3307 domain-containing protein [Chitinivibrionales bacterium]